MAPKPPKTLQRQYVSQSFHRQFVYKFNQNHSQYKRFPIRYNISYTHTSCVIQYSIWLYPTFNRRAMLYYVAFPSLNQAICTLNFCGRPKDCFPIRYRLKKETKTFERARIENDSLNCHRKTDRRRIITSGRRIIAIYIYIAIYIAKLVPRPTALETTGAIDWKLPKLAASFHATLKQTHMISI